jgi:hypothetical protein
MRLSSISFTHASTAMFGLAVAGYAALRLAGYDVPHDPGNLASSPPSMVDRAPDPSPPAGRSGRLDLGPEDQVARLTVGGADRHTHVARDPRSGVDAHREPAVASRTSSDDARAQSHDAVTSDVTERASHDDAAGDDHVSDDTSDDAAADDTAADDTADDQD